MRRQSAAATAFSRPPSKRPSRERLGFHDLDLAHDLDPSLVALFGNPLRGSSDHAEQCLHLAAIGLSALAVALIMTPAAYHRQTGPRQVTAKFIRISTRLLLCSMVPLAMSICVDFYLISRIILGLLGAAILASGLFLVFAALWFGFPRWIAADKKP